MDTCYYCHAPAEIGLYARHVVCPVSLCAECARKPSEVQALRERAASLEAALGKATKIVEVVSDLGRARVIERKAREAWGAARDSEASDAEVSRLFDGWGDAQEGVAKKAREVRRLADFLVESEQVCVVDAVLGSEDADVALARERAEEVVLGDHIGSELDVEHLAIAGEVRSPLKQESR